MSYDRGYGEWGVSPSRTWPREANVTCSRVEKLYCVQHSEGSRYQGIHVPGLNRDRDFSFEDLQMIEKIEEHAKEALLVITLNNSVLSALSQQYTYIMESTSCPYELKKKSLTEFERFVGGISDISAQNQTQRARVETLTSPPRGSESSSTHLYMRSDKKADANQSYGILEYRNVEASKELTHKAKYSADHVEYMTQQMKQEAVFMRIITLVTLFFLPGTFVSVGYHEG